VGRADGLATWRTAGVQHHSVTIVLDKFK